MREKYLHCLNNYFLVMNFIYQAKEARYLPGRHIPPIQDQRVETSLPDSSDSSILTIIECKDYSGGVPVDDLEEFDSKLSQLKHHNVKGLFVTKNYFQSGAIEHATSRGIGLMRLNGSDIGEWVVRRTESKNQYDLASSARVRLSSSSSDGFISIAKGFAFENLPDYLIGTGLIDFFVPRPCNLTVPYLSPLAIQTIVDEIPTSEIYEGYRLDHARLIKFVKENFETQFVFDRDLGTSNRKTILGKLKHEPTTIFVSKVLFDDKFRWRFTLAHEIGHLFLHQEIISLYLNEMSDVEESIYIKDNFPEALNRNMEIQANLFASTILLSAGPFLQEVDIFFHKENIRRGYLYVDHQVVNKTLLFNLLTDLKRKFWVSKEAARIRLQSLNLIRFS